MTVATKLEAAPVHVRSVLESHPPGEASEFEADASRELRHELGNALTAASAYTEWLLLSRSASADEREYRALQVIRDSVARAIRLLDQRAAPRPPMPHLLQDLVELAVHQAPCERIHDILISKVTHDAPVVGADPDAVVQILTNLIGNAVKYSVPGTPIEVEIDCAEGKGYVVVRDGGIGLEPGSTEAIFDGYRSPQAYRMADGHGIGLRLSRRLALEAGGRLWATGAPGRGTSFHLELPLADTVSRSRSRLGSVDADPQSTAPRHDAVAMS